MFNIRVHSLCRKPILLTAIKFTFETMVCSSNTQGKHTTLPWKNKTSTQELFLIYFLSWSIRGEAKLSARGIYRYIDFLPGVGTNRRRKKRESNFRAFFQMNRGPIVWFMLVHDRQKGDDVRGTTRSTWAQFFSSISWPLCSHARWRAGELEPELGKKIMWSFNGGSN